jgi:hypothetical protein
MTPAEKINERLARLQAIKSSYLKYLDWRILEQDWHGGWDACVNLSEVEQEMAGLRFALDALGEVP